MAYRMNSDEREVWNLHASGMTIPEVSSETGMSQAEARRMITRLWAKDTALRGLVGDMNQYQMKMMKQPSIETDYCPFCGKPPSNRHHIVPRSQGGKDGPTITVCGTGNMSGCHKLLHDHKLHIRFTTRWEYLRTDEPMKFHEAMMQKGWRELKVRETC